jgi:hypothetical protein
MHNESRRRIKDRYPSPKNAPVATFIHPFGHIYPPQVTPLIVKFFQEHLRRA